MFADMRKKVTNPSTEWGSQNQNASERRGFSRAAERMSRGPRGLATEPNNDATFQEEQVTRYKKVLSEEQNYQVWLDQ